jgi:3'-5' exoribonuclease
LILASLIVGLIGQQSAFGKALTTKSERSVFSKRKDSRKIGALIQALTGHFLRRSCLELSELIVDEKKSGRGRKFKEEIVKQISELLLGESFTTFLILQRKDIRRTHTGAPYLALEFSDASGQIEGRLWDEAERVAGAVEIGQVVKVQGAVEEYKEKKQIKVEKMRSANDQDEFALEKLIPSTDADPEQLWQQFEKMMQSVAHPFLLSLLRKFFDEPEFVQSFCRAPAAKRWHHSYLGGLLEHTLGVATICDRVAKLYPLLDRDLLVTAALLHDIGKVDSYQQGPAFEYTDIGRLIGHIVLGSQLVAEKIRSFPQFPEELALRLQHLILSHQGMLEQASPVLPMTREAFVLYYADEIDSKLNAFERVYRQDRGGKWSKYVNLLERYFYFGEKSKS